ncbi:uncharacterized protein LOC130448495 [Diorhabda sublineata]|uniref:uncharacterized protein LOC130448495 n=1 Tax=Diorhabda sublineata TaxID=1163346 RepID=UPI0024E11BA3|nr:uncharacterized protein LOC130448495 [Diorhabda sublineata]
MRGSTAGLPGTVINGYNTSYYNILTILDLSFSLFVICPCVVGYWRGVWLLMDIYLVDFSPSQSGLISVIIGLIGHGVFTCFQKFFEEKLHPDKNRVLYYVLSRLYTLCFGFTCVNGWRGPWELLDIPYKTDVMSICATTGVGIVALLSMRGLRNVIAPPFVIVCDDVQGYFEVATMFRTMGERTSLYILDCLFSIVIVGTLVVFVWRGVWLLVDVFLFPDDYLFSNWSSLVLGYFSVGIAFLLQPAMKYLCERLTGVSRLLVADIFILFALFGTVNVWRGIWNLLNIYFLPDNLELSGWITHWVSLIVLFLCRCSNSLLVRGVYIDAEEPGGECAVFPCYYLRIIFMKKKLKKMNLNAYNLNDTIKVNQKEVDMQHNNHVVNINTISSSIQDSKDSKPTI